MISVLNRGKPHFVDKGSSYSLFSMSAEAVKNRKDNWCSLSPLYDEESFKESRKRAFWEFAVVSLLVIIKGLLPIDIKRVEASMV